MPSYTYDSLSRVAERNGTGFAYTGLWIDPTSDGVNTYGRSPAGRVVASDDDTVTSLVPGSPRRRHLARRQFDGRVVG
ncbi:MAG: hypothetical protein IIA44_13105 [Acidobacteria bacterium]|nr:hypothetical protein [Acidobacteriota bacterium]